jgi:hypothetical protein
MNWERMLREREEGRSVVGPAVVPARPAENLNATPPAAVNPERELSLFERYCAAKALQGHDVSVDRKSFDEQIEQQRQRIEARLGQPVRFEVQVDDGNVRVVARKKKRT